MEKTGWKITAIIFIILFLLGSAFVIWAVYYSIQEEEKTNLCYYEVCGEYPEAIYEEGICTCYDYDLVGNLVVAKNKVM